MSASSTFSKSNSTVLSSSVPTALAFLQKEFHRYDREKQLWELERGEFMSRIATLDGQNKSNEKIQYDLMRRIKMLEVALRSERHKFELLLQSVQNGESITPEFLQQIHQTSTHAFTAKEDSMTPQELKNTTQTAPQTVRRIISGKTPKSSQVLRKFLEDINATDAWMFVENTAVETEKYFSETVSTSDSLMATMDSSLSANSRNFDSLPTIQISEVSNNNSNSMELDSSDNLQFRSSDTLYSTITEEKSSTVIVGNKPQKQDENWEEKLQEQGMKRESIEKLMSKSSKKNVSWDFDAEETSSKTNSKSSFSSSENSKLLKGLQDMKLEDNKKDTKPASSASLQHSLKLKPQYTLYSHLDGVRSIAFHETEQVVFSASEDCTIKVWNLDRCVSTKQAISTHPTHTYRGHTGSIFALETAQDCCLSAGEDGTIRVWNLPDLQQEEFVNYGYASALSRKVWHAHDDAIWSLSKHPQFFEKDLLLSASADKSIKLWSCSNSSKPLQTLIYKNGEQKSVPTCVRFVPSDASQCIVSFADNRICKFDLETGKVLWRYEGSSNIESTIYQIAVHNTMPLVISANEDKSIRFLDTNTGLVSFETVGHRDATTSISIDSSGLYFASGGHDGSLRIWDIGAKSCIQDFSAHRKKCDEAVHQVLFHNTKNMVATCGADALVKTFTF